MTTDNFTEAASAAAEEQWTRDLAPSHPLPGPRRMDRRIGFEIGALWAHTHLAAQEGHRRVRKYADDWDTCACGYDAWPCRSQEPTDAEVEAAAFALAVEGDDIEEWDSLSTYGQAMYLRDARAALSAARAARRDEDGLGDAQSHRFPAPLDYLNDDRRDEEKR